MRNEECSITALYSEPYDFSLSVHDDIDTFMNLKEFAAIHEIDSKKLPGIITLDSKNTIQQDGTYTRGLVLWIQDSYVSRAEPGMQVRIDGSTYVIGNARLIQGEMWRIELVIADG